MIVVGGSRRFRGAVIACAVLAVSIGCGPKSLPEVIPTLPGDGIANVVQPASEPAAAADPWTGRTDLIAAPAPMAPQAVALPAIERFTLANGLEVIVVKNDRLPVMQMQLAIRAGRAEEPLARLGVAELTANLLPKGTRKRDALAIAKAVDFVGASVTADAGHEATWITCSSLAKDQKLCLDLLPEMVTSPSFADVEISNAKEAMLGDILRRLDDAGALAGSHIQNFLWGNDHVRGWVLGANHLRQLARPDLVAWHKTWFAPNNAMLAVSGAVDVARLKAELTRAFGGWKKAKLPARPKYVDPPLTAPRIRVVDKPGQTQTHIRVAQYGLRHDDPRFFASLVWNYALGGGSFSSRLMKVVRSDGGKAYGASSTFDRNLERGAFVATTFTRTAETVHTLDLILGELRKMHTSGATEAEVASAIANIAGGYSMRIAGARELASALLTADLHGLSQAYISDFPLLVGRVTTGEAAEAAASILSPDALAVVLAGDGAKIAEQLDSAGLKYERVSFDAPIGPQPAKEIKVDAVASAAGIKVLDAALAAKGGAKVGQLKSLRLTAEGNVTAKDPSGQDQSAPVLFSRVLVMPDQTRVDITLAKDTKITLALSGASGWAEVPRGGVQDLPASQILEIERQRWMDPEWILLRHREAGTIVALLPETVKIGAATCDVVDVTSADGAFAVKLFIDRATKMLLQLSYGTGPAPTVESYGDYRAVAGIQIAHQRDTASKGETSVLKVVAVEVNPAVAPAVFDRPVAGATPSGTTP